MLSKSPLVSVCIPTRNGEAFLGETLESVSSQDYPNLEIVVSDDASVDRTLEIVSDFKGRSDRPVHIHHHSPSTIGANWNQCLFRARGKYVKFLMQDDLLAAGCVREMVKAAESNESIGLVYCRRKVLVCGEVPNIERWMERCGTLHDKLATGIENGLVQRDSVLGDRNFVRSPRNKIGEPSCVLFRRDVMARIGEFREDLRQTLDYEYWYRILAKYDAYFLDQELAVFRRHIDQATVWNERDDEDNAVELAKLWMSYFRCLFFHLHWTNKRFVTKACLKNILLIMRMGARSTLSKRST